MKELIEVKEWIPEHKGQVWLKKNNEAVSLIVKSLDNTFLECVQGEKYVRNIVSKLNKVYAWKSTACMWLLKKELSNL